MLINSFNHNFQPLTVLMNQIKNIHFTLLLKVNKKLHEFNFRLRDPALYDTDTADERGTRFYFKMIKKDEAWQIQGNNLPSWIVDNEMIISNALLNQESGQFN